MAEVILKNIKKVYPHQEPAKKKKGSEEKKTNLQITDEGVLAVQEFSLNIADKEFIVLVGPSGCGKSTTLRMVAGLEEISGGELYIDGKLMNDVAPKDRDIAMVFQNYALYPHMTVRENMAFPLKLKKYPKEEIRKRVDQAAEVLGITEYLDRKPKALSGGQRQRVGIAQALLGDPTFLIFDEPTVGLDPEERIHFRNLFSRTAQDRLVLLSTHIIEDVQSVCDQIVVINHGQIRFTGTPEQLIASAAGHVGVFWEKDERQEQGLHITARVNTSQGVRCRAVADQLPPYVQAEEPTLEDAYLYLISREAVQ